MYCTLKNWIGSEPSVDDGTTDHFTMTDSSLRRVMLGFETLGRFAVYEIDNYSKYKHKSCLVLNVFIYYVTTISIVR